MIGTCIGPYATTARLGEGGMGVVCRAADARFDRKTRLLAQLNHPDIALLFASLRSHLRFQALLRKMGLA